MKGYLLAFLSASLLLAGCEAFTQDKTKMRTLERQAKNREEQLSEYKLKLRDLEDEVAHLVSKVEHADSILASQDETIEELELVTRDESGLVDQVR